MMAYLILFVIGIVSARTVSPDDNDTEDDIRHTREIRCSCNLPSCVQTNYMCKSLAGGCFSEILQTSERVLSGCLDLRRDKNVECQNKPGSREGVNGSLLLCCNQDMCNHADGPVTRAKFNDSVHAVAVSLIGSNADETLLLSGDTMSGSRHRTTGGGPSYTSQEVWFKAATIAVPICGALILLILILLAVKILKSDPQALPPKYRSKGGSGTTSLLSGVVAAHNPSAETGCTSSKKLPLLYHQNDCTNIRTIPEYNQHQVDKNEAHAKLNVGSDLIDLTKPSGHTAPPTCNLYQPLLSASQLNSGNHHNNLYSSSDQQNNSTTIEDKTWIDNTNVVGKFMQEYSLKFNENYPKTNFCNNSYQK